MESDINKFTLLNGLVTLNWIVFKRTVTIENQEKR